MKKLFTHARLISSMILSAACASSPSGPRKFSNDPNLDYLQEGAVLQLQYNLHPDERLRRVYSMNYQLDSILPRCMPVTLIRQSNKGIVFSVNQGAEYTWFFDKYIRANPMQYFASFFVPQCDDASGLSEIDRQGINEGKPLVGMTKQGVLYAMGIPPDHQTPNLDMNLWTYWRNRYVRTTVHFQDGFVVEVK